MFRSLHVSRPLLSIDCPLRLAKAFSLLLLLLGLVGCTSQHDNEVVVYTALDREFSEPLFAEFTRTTGIVVRAKYDTEANKTVGLVNLILREKQRPRCDLFWNNEILHTLRLQRQGLLVPYASPAAEAYPAQYRSPQSAWHGFAARARVLLVNTELMKEEKPSSIDDLIDPRWRGQTGVAKPLFGTTATHAACLFQVWGKERASRFFEQLSASAQVFPGNRQVAQAVGEGRIRFGLTDTDDAVIELERGMPVAIVYPDQGENGLGTLFIPNTLGLISGSNHPEAAQRLIDFLLSPETEARLAAGESAQIPLQTGVKSSSRVATPADVRPMRVDFEGAAAGWEAAAQELDRLFP